MDIVERAQALLNLGVVTYTVVAAMLLVMLGLLCAGVTAIEHHGVAAERRRAARRDASYGATRRRVLAQH